MPERKKACHWLQSLMTQWQMEIKGMSFYLFIPHIFIGDLSLYWRLEILSGRKQSVPSRSSRKQPASFLPNVHLHFFLGKELDHICQPTLQDRHVASSFHWDVAGAGKSRQLVMDRQGEDAGARWLEPGSLIHVVEQKCPWPGIPTYAVS